ncbi:MAG: DUF1489 family protein [Alphaproteobacteria bacterium]|nr:DUF1489 family protein [Alphaproteobacteria bacterium]
MPVHMIKLVVGIETLQDFYELQKREAVEYYGQKAVPCWTRYKPRQADDIIRSEGSIYRVIKNRIQCRAKILGFEMVETDNGTKCMIMQSTEMVQTVSTPRRPFQGWRYLKLADVPEDRSIYLGQDVCDTPPEDMKNELEEMGLL